MSDKKSGTWKCTEPGCTYEVSNTEDISIVCGHLTLRPGTFWQCVQPGCVYEASDQDVYVRCPTPGTSPMCAHVTYPGPATFWGCFHLGCTYEFFNAKNVPGVCRHYVPEPQHDEKKQTPVSERQDCCVCLSVSVDTFLPCGHAVCKSCAGKMNKCPTCRRYYGSHDTRPIQKCTKCGGKSACSAHFFCKKCSIGRWCLACITQIF